MSIKIRILLIFSMMFLVSCSSMKNKINRNHKKTNKLISSLLEENGNAFYLKSSYASFSRVWSYTHNQIKIYRLGAGKIYEKNTYTRTSVLSNEIPTFNEIQKVYKKCGFVLDGSSFGFKIKDNDNLIQEDLPTDIECLKKGKYQSDFFNQIVQDILTYKMWEVKID